MIQRAGAPSIDVVYRGCGFDAGYEIGGALADKMEAAFTAIADFDSFRAGQPWWMPYGVYQYLAERRAKWALEKPLAAVLPSANERIQGMATGSVQAIERFYLFQAMELLSAAYECPQPSSFAACTAVAIAPQRTRSRRPLLAHNFDVVSLARPMFTLRNGIGRHARWLEFSMAPLAGTIDGMNDHGLCIVYNYAMGRASGPVAPPTSVHLFDVLVESNTVEQAIDQLVHAPRCGAALLMLADAGGNLAALELTHSDARVRYPKDGILFHSNAFQNTHMKKQEVPRDARYADDAPESLRGKRIFDSPIRRDQRMAELLSQSQQPWDLPTLEILMGDHGGEGIGSEDTICMHGPYWSTHSAIQMDPVERRMRVSYGPACEAGFRDFAL
jgi:hypothetical protein